MPPADLKGQGLFVRLVRSSHLFVLLVMLVGCSSSGSDSPVTGPIPDIGETDRALVLDRPGVHLQTAQSLVFDPETNEITLIPDRTSGTHLDLAYFRQYFPGMLKVELVDFDLDQQLVTLSITFTNPLQISFGDVRAIFSPDGYLVPVTFDGWTTRGGGSSEKPNLYFGFGNDAPLRRLEKGESDTREIVFRYELPISLKKVTFILDATVDNNTAEPYAFGPAQLTGRFFHMAISDWQEDITTAFLHPAVGMWPVPLRMAPFGEDGEWGTSIPDISPGNYHLRVTAESPESAGEDNEGEPVVAVHFVDLHWPPEGPLVPLPKGMGIFAYGFRDPDTNAPPDNVEETIAKFRDSMGGSWVMVHYGAICNSGYLSMYETIPATVKLIHAADPDLPIYLNLDKLSFPPASQDPCQHDPEKYTELFFDHLLESIRGQMLENPDFECISGIHFDIEIFPQSYTEDELQAIYYRYADFLGRLHMEPEWRGRVTLLYEFDRHPHMSAEDLPYLCTVDAFCPACFHTRFAWDWDLSETTTPFFRLEKMLAKYCSWAMQYGRPYYPILGTFSGWTDGNEDTLGEITACSPKPRRMIDDFCFGNSDFDSINEFEIVKNRDVHGMYVERVILTLPTGEPVFPSNGLAVYLLGDADPANEGDDIVGCRTAYSMARARRIIHENRSSLMAGTATFRYENNLSWKAATQATPLARGEIAGVSGRIRFSDHTSIQYHPELWDSLRIELIDPLTPEIVDSLIFRTSIDLFGVEDGSYIFPDLPSEIVTIQAFADGWSSQEETVDLRGYFVYRDNIDLMMSPE